MPATKVRPVAAMLKAIHASEDRAAARAKVLHVDAKLHELKLPAAATLVQGHIEGTFSYNAFPREHQRSLRTDNPLERIMREIRAARAWSVRSPTATRRSRWSAPGSGTSLGRPGAPNVIWTRAVSARRLPGAQPRTP